MWHIDIMKHSEIERDEALIHATMYRNLKNSILTKRKSQKITYYMIQFIGNAQNRQIY